MPLKFQCQCGTKLVVSSRYAGRRVKCPHCSEPIEVPEAEEESPAKANDGPPVTPRTPAATTSSDAKTQPKASSRPKPPREPGVAKKTVPAAPMANIESPQLHGTLPDTMAHDADEVEAPPVQGQAGPRTANDVAPTPPPVAVQIPSEQALPKGPESLAAESSPPDKRPKKADPISLDRKPNSPIATAPTPSTPEARQEEKQPVADKQRTERKPADKAGPSSPPPLPTRKQAAYSSPREEKPVPTKLNDPSSIGQHPKTQLPETQRPETQEPTSRPAEAQPSKGATSKDKAQRSKDKTQPSKDKAASSTDKAEPSKDVTPPSRRPTLEAESAETDEPGSGARGSNESNRDSGNIPARQPGKPKSAGDASRASARPPLPVKKASARANPKPVRPSSTKTPVVASMPAGKSDASHIDDAASTATVSSPRPDPAIQAAALPGYQPTEDQVAIVRAIGVSLALVAATSAIPAIMDIIDHFRAAASLGVARWAYLVLMLATLQVAYAAYVYQLPDWSTVWVVTIVTLVIATAYAMMLGLSLITRGDVWLISILDMGDAFRGGRVSLWCFVMLCLTSLVSYFSGRISVRWRDELTAT